MEDQLLLRFIATFFAQQIYTQDDGCGVRGSSLRDDEITADHHSATNFFACRTRLAMKVNIL